MGKKGKKEERPAHHRQSIPQLWQGAPPTARVEGKDLTVRGREPIRDDEIVHVMYLLLSWLFMAGSFADEGDKSSWRWAAGVACRESPLAAEPA